MKRAAGTFEVQLKPMTTHASDDSTQSRFSLDKQFVGDLVGTSKGEMLAVGGSVTGSAAYVAVERVSGTLQGRRGTFALHHTGIMTRGTPSLVIHVVPDSGTDDLKGISGTMTIRIEGKKHFYDFDYTITPTP